MSGSNRSAFGRVKSVPPLQVSGCQKHAQGVLIPPPAQPAVLGLAAMAERSPLGTLATANGPTSEVSARGKEE